jgi:hypothetical protein
MVRILWILLFSLVFPGLTVAKVACTKGTEFEPALCPIALPSITRLKVQKNGQKSTSPQGEASSCSDFKISKEGVRKFLKKAKQVSERDARETLDWSPCYAGGTIVFANGTKANWSVGQLRSGTIDFVGRGRVFLYCPDCGFSPFK